MREIIFRGKRSDNGEWVTGGIFINVTLLTQHKIPHIVNTEDIYTVLMDTVGQFAGVTDKKGVRVFEGDVLICDKYPYTYEGERNYYGVVLWFEDSHAFGILTARIPNADVSGASDGNTDYIEDWKPDEWEIVGNVYDNPELVNIDNY